MLIDIPTESYEEIGQALKDADSSLKALKALMVYLTILEQGIARQSALRIEDGYLYIDGVKITKTAQRLLGDTKDLLHDRS